MRRALLLPLLLSACASDGPPPDEERLLILAASSLNTALPELVELYETRTGVGADLVLGATGSLAAQIQQGAPADVLLTADAVTIGRLVAAGLIAETTRIDFAAGRLALVVADGRRRPTGIADLRDPSYEVIALANPQLAPYGVAGREALEGTGIWRMIEPRVVYGETIAQALQLVRTGNADAALVAMSLVAGDSGDAAVEIPDTLHTPIRHEAAAVAGSHPRAIEFLALLLSDSAQAILRRRGFGAPGGD